MSPADVVRTSLSLLADGPVPLDTVVADLGLRVTSRSASIARCRHGDTQVWLGLVDGDRVREVGVAGGPTADEVAGLVGPGMRAPAWHEGAVPSVVHTVDGDGDLAVRVVVEEDADGGVHQVVVTSTVRLSDEPAPSGRARAPLAREVDRLVRGGRVHELAALLREALARDEDVGVVLRDVLEASEDDVAWVAWWRRTPAMLADEEVAMLLLHLVDRRGGLPAMLPPRLQASRDVLVPPRGPEDRLPAPRGTAWNMAERQLLLGLRDRDRATLAGLADDLSPEAGRLERRIALWRLLYIGGTPVVPISRHPGSGALVHQSFDPFGIDGLWWDPDVRHRPDPPTPVAGWLGTTGGHVRGPAPTRSPMTWHDSPVSSRLLDSGAIGVLSTLVSGASLFHVVSWFAPDAREREPAPELGRTTVAVHGPGGRFSGYATTSPLGAVDEIGAAVDDGRLRWHLPGDTSLEIRTGRQGCPYVDSDGVWVGAAGP